ncbi:MAG TPA: glycosyltransferase family 2 protein [Gaiellaceae bacterium]|nr:glycosyltransferase family 2 protein [Gaiellaceae bacterium]
MPPELDVTVVIPAFNAERTVGRVVEALRAQEPAPARIVVVDDGSQDATAAVAAAAGATVVPTREPRFAGGARNAGWEAAEGAVVVFLDADAIPAPGWGAGLARALQEFPGALVGCARTFDSRTAWGWVAHLQGETPYLPLGEPRRVPFLSSYCVAVPRDVPFRWDESYGGEDGVFCADARRAGYELVFDPRFHAHHDHDRETWRDLRRQQRRMAYGIVRTRRVVDEGRLRSFFARVPLHHFALLRLPVIYRRLGSQPELRRRFLRSLPRLVVAEWALGASAVRYALSPPPAQGQAGRGFR